MSIENQIMSRERESNDYDEILKHLELWAEELAARGPKAVEEIQDEMHQYLEKMLDKDFDAFKKECEALKKEYGGSV